MLDKKLGIGKLGNKVEAVFKRIDRWSLHIPNILEEQFVKLTPAMDLPFGDLSVWMSVEADKVEKLKELLPFAKKATIKRFDGCGTLQEEWSVTLEKVYNIQENTYQDDPYGDMEFKIKWTGRKKQ